jgi:rod shape-determining protein MreD
MRGGKVIRFLIFLLSAFLLGVFQSTLVSLIFPPYLMPDLIILLVIFLGISFPLLPGAFLALFCGLLCDTFSGGVLGLFVFVYLCIFFSLKLLAKFLILGEGLFFRVILVAALVGFQALLLIVLPASLGIASHLSWPSPGWLLPQVLLTSGACWPFFRLFRRLDVPLAEEFFPSIS